MSRLSLALFTIIVFVLSFCKEAKPAVPSDAERLALFKATPQENLKPTRWDTGDTTMGNEDRLDLFFADAQNLGGGYIGVGSLQNFLLGAWAKSEYMWLMDFTRIVVATNKIHIAFIKESKTPQDFVNLWKKQNEKQAKAIIERVFKNDAEYNFIRKSYRQAHFYVNKRITIDLMLSKKRKYAIWLTDATQYSHIRKLALAGKIQAIKGDLAGDITVKGIGATAKKMKLPMRLLYFSNAEEYVAICWPCNPKFMGNMLSLPIDAKSLVFRTVSSPNRRIFTWAPGSELTTSRGFHYNVMPGTLFHEWMNYHEEKFRMPEMLKGAEINKKDGFSKAILSPPKKGADKTDTPKSN